MFAARSRRAIGRSDENVVKRSARSPAPTHRGRPAAKSARRTVRSGAKSVRSGGRCAARSVKRCGGGNALRTASDMLRCSMDQRKNWLRSSAVYGLALAVSMLGLGPAVHAQPLTGTPETAPSTLTERERLLLERLEQLERRVNELEAQVRATVSPVPDGLEPVP